MSWVEYYHARCPASILCAPARAHRSLRQFTIMAETASALVQVLVSPAVRRRKLPAVYANVGRREGKACMASLPLSLSLTSIFLNPRWFIGRRQDGKRKSSCLLFSRVEVSSVLSTIVLGGCAERP